MTAEPLVLLTRRQCHLCELVRASLTAGASQRGLTLTEIDIDENPELRRCYNDRVPVLLLGNTVLGEGRFDPLAALSAISAPVV